MAKWIEGRGWVRPWYWWFWGHGLEGIRGRYTTQQTRYQWWPIRVKRRDWTGRFAWWRSGLLDWHGIEEGSETFPRPVANAKRQVLPNPSWMGQHYERWHRTICAQVWHIGPVRIICGESARPLESRLTDDHIREIEAHGRSTVG